MIRAILACVVLLFFHSVTQAQTVNDVYGALAKVGVRVGVVTTIGGKTVELTKLKVRQLKRGKWAIYVSVVPIKVSVNEIPRPN